MTVLHIDIETYSESDLKTVGLYKYAHDPSTELNVVCYAFDDGPVEAWIPHAEPFALPFDYHDGQCPGDVVAHIREGGIVAAHNAQFERVILSTLGPRYGIPTIAIEQTRCTAAKAAAAGIPRSLGEAAKALGTHPKDELGRMNMLGMSRPRTGKERRYSFDKYPEKWRQLVDYCKDDVRAEAALDNRLPDLSADELAVYRLDQTINDRGVGVDLDMIDNVRALVDEYRAELEAECRALTGLNPTQTGKLADWIRAHGYPDLVDLTAANVVKALNDEACAGDARRALEIRTIHAMKAVAKYDVMAAAAHEGRLHGMLLYHGAGTGRWSSLLVQLQNLYRPVIKNQDTAIAAFEARDLSWVKTVFPTEPMKVLASCVRGALKAKEGRRLLALDYAGIENRVLAWLFDERWKLAAFEAFDRGEGADLYKLAYARAFGVTADSVTDYQRQIGKVMELALGYLGGASAFSAMAANYKMNMDSLAEAAFPVIPDDVLDEAEGAYNWALEQSRALSMPKHIFLVCDSLKRLWRREHPATVRGWKDMQDAAAKAIKQPGKAFAIPNKRIAFKVHDAWLYMRLPSGRKVAYYQPECFTNDKGRDEISYMGIDTFTRRWMRVPTHSGRLTENAVQAIARDVLVNGMFMLSCGGYPLVLTVHDELVAEPMDGRGSLEEAMRLACNKLDWMAGLPLAAAGWEGARYRK